MVCVYITYIITFLCHFSWIYTWYWPTSFFVETSRFIQVSAGADLTAKNGTLFFAKDGKNGSRAFFFSTFFFVGHTGHCGCFHFFFPFWRCLRRWADGLWHSETWRWHGQHRDPYLGAEMDGFNQGHEMEINPLEMIWCGDFFFTLTIPYNSIQFILFPISF